MAIYIGLVNPRNQMNIRSELATAVQKLVTAIIWAVASDDPRPPPPIIRAKDMAWIGVLPVDGACGVKMTVEDFSSREQAGDQRTGRYRDW